ncbi:MAG: hypothetical protein ACREQJ_14635, partial [Candidatus Binatia bacterium]
MVDEAGLQRGLHRIGNLPTWNRDVNPTPPAKGVAVVGVCLYGTGPVKGSFSPGRCVALTILSALMLSGCGFQLWGPKTAAPG